MIDESVMNRNEGVCASPLLPVLVVVGELSLLLPSLKGRLSIHALEPTLSCLLRTPFWLSCCFSDCSSLSSLQGHLHLFLWPEFPTILSPSSVFTFLSSLCITTLCRWPIGLNLQPRPSLWALYPVPDYCLSVSLWICQKHLRFNVFESELIPSSLDLDLF